MLKNTHLVGGAMAFASLTAFTGLPSSLEETVTYFLSCMIGSVLPDIDHHKSKLSNSDIVLGALSDTISTLTPHRGIVHTPLGCAGISAIGYIGAHWLSLHAEKSAAVILAVFVFVLFHIQKNVKKLHKFGGVCAILILLFYSDICSYGYSLYTAAHSFQMRAGIEIFVSKGLLVGSMCHILLDTLNPEGIMLFYPNRKRIHLATIKTGGRMESVIKCLLGIASIAIFAWSII